MAFFDDLNTNIKIIEGILLADDDFCNLLYYNHATPLSATPLPDPKILRMQNLCPLPKIPDAETEKLCMVNYYFYSSKPYNNAGFREVELCFDVICHLDLWPIKNALRPYSVLNQIDELFNHQLVEGLSGKNIRFKSLQPMRYSDKYYGYHLIYELTNNSWVGC